MASSGKSDLTPNAEFHMYIGFCIAAWAKVEEQLFDICHKCLGAPMRQASIVYYRFASLGHRLGLVDELLRSVLPPPTKNKRGGLDQSPEINAWQEIKSAIEGLLATRGRIAHRPVNVKYKLETVMTKKDGKPEIEGINLLSSFEIFFSEAERLRGKIGDVKPLIIDDLSIHCVQVQAMADRLERFSADILQAHLK